MRKLVSLLRNGRSLRHVPVVYSDFANAGLRVTLHGLEGGTRDVTADHVPVSLQPLILGVRLDTTDIDAAAVAKRLFIAISDARSGDAPLARIGVKMSTSLPLANGALQLLETTYSHNACAPRTSRWWRYALAWQHARRTAGNVVRFHMSARDLRALNAYYTIPRPVYLVGVAEADRTNLFPMDLVGRVTSGEFLLALRATSPAISTITSTRRIAMSAAPAGHLKAVYALGAQHRKTSVDLSELPFALERSPELELPVLRGSSLMRELTVRQICPIGSHVLFISHVDCERGDIGEQLAHVSLMYVEHLRRAGRIIETLAP